jgi:ribosomal protein S14
MPTTRQLAMTRPELSQTCDRCGPAVRAVYRAHRNGELYLCRHCANQLRSALSAQEWTIRLIDEYALTPHVT